MEITDPCEITISFLQQIIVALVQKAGGEVIIDDSLLISSHPKPSITTFRDDSLRLHISVRHHNRTEAG